MYTELHWKSYHEIYIALSCDRDETNIYMYIQTESSSRLFTFWFFGMTLLWWNFTFQNELWSLRIASELISLTYIYLKSVMIGTIECVYGRILQIKKSFNLFLSYWELRHIDNLSQ